MGTMCAKRYVEVKQKYEKSIEERTKSIEEKHAELAVQMVLKNESNENNNTVKKIDDNTQRIEQLIPIIQHGLDNEVLQLHRHLSTVRPINLNDFRHKFDALFHERITVLGELRMLEVDAPAK